MCAPLRLTSQVPGNTQRSLSPYPSTGLKSDFTHLISATAHSPSSHRTRAADIRPMLARASAPLKTSFTDLPVLFVPFSSWWRAVYFFAHRAPLRPSSYLFSIVRRRLEVAILREAGVVLRCAHALELLLGREARAVVGGVDARLIVREQEELCASAARDSMRGGVGL